ncbi:putative zinc-type alcohol dehydrogenase-like protein YogA [Marinithermofilum abyssi]|uniref:Putative zinc-type alcohol dehydrogenase-like protein YogA n=1 Tax=Marinithermofilum abyssi TaxID=1571185 RepID=A0A8J2VET7_9BACL|nr:zinc-binding dehydrogenase [Marinithermofilum abyssi]GGE11982.1 putative zinc-type alcohol dehydrogenase-like protein YogA [Marinithermofilum abyssi]
MNAVVHHGPGGFDSLDFRQMEEREPGPNEVKVRLRSAGLNHRDIWMLFREREHEDPVILGSDGAGIVKAVGENVTNVAEGDKVVINPSLNWPRQSDAPPKNFEILGVPTAGTFAENIVIPAENVEKKPAHLNWEEAGVLPLAALTAYRALFTRAKIQPGEHVLIPGIGSGVATYALQFAKAVGAKVTVTSRSKMKRNRALELGADHAIDSHGDWEEAMKGEKADVVIESIGPATFLKSLSQLRPGGRMVTYGATTGDEVTLPLREFFYGQFNLLGTTMGSAEEFRAMLDFVCKQKIHPVIDKVYPLAEAAKGFLRMEEGEQFGKICFITE